MNKAPDIKRDLIELQDKIEQIFKLNQFQRELERLKEDDSEPSNQQISISDHIVQEKLLKVMATGINLNKFPKLNEYTKEQILGWTRFLNDHHIDLKVCGIDDTCYLMRYFLHSHANLSKTKKTITVFKDVCLRSDRNK